MDNKVTPQIDTTQRAMNASSFRNLLHEKITTQKKFKQKLNLPWFLLTINYHHDNYFYSNNQNYFNDLKIKPNLTINTKSFSILCSYSKKTNIYINYQTQETVIFIGKIYNNKYSCDAEYIYKCYKNKDVNFPKFLDGAFLAIIINPQANKIIAITDRINSQKIFFSEYNGCYILSSSLYLHPIDKHNLDITGIAWYLANGTIHNNRTLFDGINSFKRAHIYELREDGLHSYKYWDYKSLNTYTDDSFDKLFDELSYLLISSVKRIVRDNPKVLISLSGGYDSRGLLGLLNYKIGGNIQTECFSYDLGKPKIGSDGYVAAKVAKFTNNNHTMIQAYNRNIIDLIINNAIYGEGISNFSDEFNAWLNLKKKFNTKLPAVLVAGDNCFGFDDGVEMHSLMDVLNKHNQIYEFDSLKWVSKILGVKRYMLFFESLHEDINQFIKRIPQIKDYYDLASYVYIDQRIPNTLMPWRYKIIGSFSSFSDPFLSNDLIDYMKKIPSSMRKGRKLYRITIKKMFPKLFEIPFAKSPWNVPNWTSELNLHSYFIESYIKYTSSKLDEIIPPEFILLLIKKNNNRLYQFRNSYLKILNTAKRKLMKNSNIKKELDISKLLIRILTIRFFLTIKEDFKVNQL